MLYVGEGPRGNCAACSTLCRLSVTSPTTHKRTGPLWCWFPGGLVYVLGPCGSLQQTLQWVWEFLPLTPQPPQVLSVRGLRLYFPAGALGCGSVSLPSCSPQFICTEVWDPRSASHCLAGSPLRPAAHLCPSCHLGECFFFNSLIVGLPYSLIFWQFWLFIVFKFVVLLLVVRGGTVCLPTHPSWMKVPLPILNWVLCLPGVELHKSFIYFAN